MSFMGTIGCPDSAFLLYFSRRKSANSHTAKDAEQNPIVIQLSLGSAATKAFNLSNLSVYSSPITSSENTGPVSVT
jgi:uncharacterized protein YraI